MILNTLGYELGYELGYKVMESPVPIGLGISLRMNLSVIGTKSDGRNSGIKVR